VVSPYGASRSHSDTPHSIGLLWKSNQPDAETSTWQKHNTQKRQTSTPLAGFELAIPGSYWPQTHALDRAATGIGLNGIVKCNSCRWETT